jgi:hypothetical protein
MMLAVLGYAGIGELLSQTTFVVKRKLEKNGPFIATAFDVDANTTMADVILSLSIPAVTPIARSSVTRTSGSVNRSTFCVISVVTRLIGKSGRKQQLQLYARRILHLCG